ncbi:hypothetical protein, partial [Burkholderia ubonensis]|uniref:hypothetical protein n=1 Tax=Burkholderia ubonensis TaxID=101571 RepID=UPI0012F9D2FB
VRAIDSVRSGDEIELSQRNFYLNSIGSRPSIPARIAGRIAARTSLVRCSARVIRIAEPAGCRGRKHRLVNSLASLRRFDS